jgi:cytochrome P450
MYAKYPNFTHAAYNLAAYPEYIEPIREEIEFAIKNEGLTKKSLTRMCKLDSFIKETMRMHPLVQCMRFRNHTDIVKKSALVEKQ